MLTQKIKYIVGIYIKRSTMWNIHIVSYGLYLSWNTNFEETLYFLMFIRKLVNGTP